MTGPVRSKTTATEQEVSRICTEILGRDDMRAQDDLFDLGVASLDVIRILVAVNKRFGISLTGAELTAPVSVEHMAEYIESLRD